MLPYMVQVALLANMAYSGESIPARMGRLSDRSTSGDFKDKRFKAG
jgi:hypothetical protein